MNTTEIIVGRMSAANSNYPNIGDTVIAHEIRGAEMWNDEPCVVTAIDTYNNIITGEFKSKQKPDDTISLSFQIWSPANPVTAADVRTAEPEMDIDAYKLAIEALNKQVADLTTERDRYQSNADAYSQDFYTVGEALMQEAERRGWCDEYDEFVESVQGNLSRLELPTRQQEYEVTVTGTAVVSWSHTVTVTAKSEDDAISMVEDCPSDYFDTDEAANDSLNYGYGWDSNDIEDVRVS